MTPHSHESRQDLSACIGATHENGARCNQDANTPDEAHLGPIGRRANRKSGAECTKRSIISAEVHAWRQKQADDENVGQTGVTLSL